MTNFSLEVLNPLVLLCGCLLYCKPKAKYVCRRKGIERGSAVLFISFGFSLRKNAVYYINKSVLLENTPLVKFIRNYIRDPSGVFSMSSFARILITSFPALSWLFMQTVGEKWRAKYIISRLLNYLAIIPLRSTFTTWPTILE